MQFYKFLIISTWSILSTLSSAKITPIPQPDMYRTFWRIKSINDILTKKDCWIIIAEDSIGGKQNEETKAFISHLNWLSNELAGIVFFGLLESFDDIFIEINSKKGIKAPLLPRDKETNVPNAYVFPYGGKAIKTSKFAVYENIQKVVHKFLPLAPEETDLSDISELIYTGYKAKPIKFPSIFTIEEKEDVEKNSKSKDPQNNKLRLYIDHDDKTVDLFQLASMKITSEIFKKYFHFNLAYSSDKKSLQRKTNMQPPMQFPEAFSFIGKMLDQEDPNGDNMKLDTVRMSVEEYRVVLDVRLGI